MRASYFSVLAFLLLAMPAGAQVSVNLDALNPPAAGQATPRANRPAARPAARPTARPRPAATGTAARRPGTTTTQPPATAAPAAPTSATPAPAGTTPAAGTAAAVGAAAAGAAALALPVAAPETPVIVPPAPPLSAAAAPPVQRPATSATAGSLTTATTDGLRVTFAPGKSDLTPESATALTDFAKKIPGGENVSLNVVAFSAGTPEDPSTARRLSLARALAIRTALMADGIASTRIYVRAMGVPAATDTGPLDRVDIAVLGIAGTQAGSQASPPTTARP